MDALHKKVVPASDSPDTQGKTAAVAPDLAAADQALQADNKADAKNLPRTPGLRAFDILLYPILTNTGVFVLSVFATYLTSRGNQRNANGELIYGKIGEFIQKRGDWMVEKFKKMGMNDGQADRSKMVFFSFADGSLLAPLVKFLEDRRGKIGRHIDHHLGTKPEDEVVYDDEPRQTWGSVLGGRLATVAIVVPTAVALEKAGLNDVLFNNPGKKFGEMIAKNPTVMKYLGGQDVPELTKISFFEAFYTSVCTAGLYFWSRLIARSTSGTEADYKKAMAEEAQMKPPATTDGAAQDAPAISKEPLADLGGNPDNPTHEQDVRGSSGRDRSKPNPTVDLATLTYAKRAETAHHATSVAT